MSSSRSPPENYSQAYEAWMDAERQAEDSQRETQRLRHLAHQAFMEMTEMLKLASSSVRWNPKARGQD